MVRWWCMGVGVGGWVGGGRAEARPTWSAGISRRRVGSGAPSHRAGCGRLAASRALLWPKLALAQRPQLTNIRAPSNKPSHRPPLLPQVLGRVSVALGIVAAAGVIAVLVVIVARFDDVGYAFVVRPAAFVECTVWVGLCGSALSCAAHGGGCHPRSVAVCCAMVCCAARCWPPPPAQAKVSPPHPRRLPL